MPADSPSRCPLCGHASALVLRDHPAYAAPAKFDVYGCEGCESRFAWPLETSAALYEQLYGAAERLPGYDRYERFRRMLPAAERPLDFLAESEDVYWGVRQALAPLRARASRPRVLELGAGMGYLTYALNRAGFEALGLDHAEAAVSKAVETFGPFYRVASAGSLAELGLGRFDAVVATELLEHLADPATFVRDAAALLGPGGRLVLTTPNRGLYPSWLAWHTDPAPIHLWWFSTTSIRRMAWGCGLQPSFIDFSAFHGRRHARRPVASKAQSLDAEGRVIFRDGVVNTTARALMARWPPLARPLGRIFVSRMGRAVARDRRGRDSLSLCAILERDEEDGASHAPIDAFQAEPARTSA